MSANRLKPNADKTELPFASSGHCCAALKGSYPMLKLGADTAVASSHVRLLGVDISLDLSVDRHVSHVCARASFTDIVNSGVFGGRWTLLAGHAHLCSG